MLRATLTFVRRGEALVTATSLVVLDAPDEDFLARHVARLREVTAAEDALLSRFRHGSAIPKLLDDRVARPIERRTHFTLIDRPRRLTFESAFRMLDGSNLERDAEVTFKREDGGRTRMTVLQKSFPNADIRDAFGAGFPGIFDPLERVAEASTARGESGHRGAPAKPIRVPRGGEPRCEG